MARKIQVPAIGGLRKVILPGGNGTSTGTAILGLEGATINLAQLKAILGLSINSGGGNIGGPGGVIEVGPGLGGGGPIVGTVKIYLTAPVGLAGEDGTPGEDGPPGAPGTPGKAGAPGAQGQPGIAAFFLAEDGQDGDMGAPGGMGPAGATGATGSTGSTGPPGPSGSGSGLMPVFIPEDNWDEAIPDVPNMLGFLTVNGNLVANQTLTVVSTATIGTPGSNHATLLFPGAQPQILATAAGAVLSLNATTNIELGIAGMTQCILIQSTGNIVMAGSTAGGTPTLQVSGGGGTNGNGLLLNAGANGSTDYALKINNRLGSTQYLAVYGDGGVTIGTGSVADEGPGTLNVAKDIYIAGVPISANAKFAAAGAAPFFMVDDPYVDDGFTFPTTIPLNLNLQTIVLRAPQGAPAPFQVFGGPNDDACVLFGSTTTGESYGIFIGAGSTATDSPITIFNALQNTQLFNITGLGALMAKGPVSTQGAIPAVTAGKTDIGTTTTATVITTVGGIALPALASTFWVVNVNGVQYGVPCFAL